MVINNILPKWYLGEVQTVYKTKVNKSDVIHIKSSFDSAKYIRNNFNINYDDKEHAGILGLNRSLRIVYHELISIGGIDMTVVDQRIIYSSLLKYRCNSYVLFHNHPSGELKVSNMDRDITKQLQESGKILYIKLIDHIIMTSKSYLSMADEGLL